MAKRTALAAVLIVGPIVVFMGASRLISTSISRDMIRTTRVDAGPIDATITASGMLVPEFEQVLSSPVEARVLHILKRPGAVLDRGDAIVDLDLSESRLALDRLEQNVSLKENQQARTRLDLESTLSDLSGRLEIKRLELQNLGTITERDRKLYADGLVSAEMLRQSELNESRARVELGQLESSERIARRATDMQIEGLSLEMGTLRKEKKEAERQIELATTRSDRKGVLTWVVSEEGATVHKGDLLARIADLTAFRVDATISDVHAGRLSVGMPAQIEVNGLSLPGRVSRISPAIQNGVMTIAVTIDDKANAALRYNLRVDVLLVTDRKDQVLRLKKGPFATGEGISDVFVVRGGAAVKTPVRFGVSSFDCFEVTEGLSEGDEVIISDTSNIRHLKRVRVR